MKQIFTLCFLLVALMSCQMSSETDTQKAAKKMTYFKDKKTGLCFAAVNSETYGVRMVVTSIACVPCDSLKNTILH